MKENSTVLTNGKAMEILESIAKEWNIDKTDVEINAVLSYLNDLCFKWMGGNWGLAKEDICQHEWDNSEQIPECIKCGKQGNVN